MMIVELIDDSDFRERLVALGIPIPEEASPETCARLALHKHEEEGVPGLPDLVQVLGERTDIMLPSVRAALDQVLLPALQ
ncbi:hypothetical protein [Halomonas sp. BC04]|uniref:hypothetical protein n=1 Tax=Halomonas sp. BC04 TaxID=1403540 RepID=UPI0003ED6E8A|nr:hypothetical protein [Halomonas sp. BC04]EWH01977.1 hypothetical protein Q427_11240 [Halomonas sp. BC04]